MNPPNPTPSAQPSVMAMKAAEAIRQSIFAFSGYRKEKVQSFFDVEEVARIIDQECAPYTAAVERVLDTWAETGNLSAINSMLRLAGPTADLARLHAEHQGKQPAQQGGETP